MIIFVSLVIVLSFLVTFIVRKRYNIPSEYGLYRHVNNLHKWVERILLIFFGTSLIIFVFVFSFTEVYLFAIGYFIILSGVRAIMEYKYDREERRYIIEFIWVISAIILFVGMLNFSLHTTTFAEVTKESTSLKPTSIKEIEIINNAWNEEGESVADKVIEKGTTTIDDQQFINRLFAELSTIELRKRSSLPVERDNFYYMYLRNSEIYTLTVYEKYIEIDSDFYKVVGANRVYELLESYDLDWINTEGAAE